jgi:hypothetical protein
VEQQLACTALRCIFNVLHMLDENRTMVHARWASVVDDVTIPGVCSVANPRPPPPAAAPPATPNARHRSTDLHTTIVHASRETVAAASALCRRQLRHAPTRSCKRAV